MNSIAILICVHFVGSCNGYRESENRNYKDSYLFLCNNAHKQYRASAIPVHGFNSYIVTSHYFDPVPHNITSLKEMIRRGNVQYAGDDLEIDYLDVNQRDYSQRSCDTCTESICPWTIRDHFDRYREPNWISYGCCSSYKCNFTSTEDGPSNSNVFLTLSTGCKQLTQDLRVIGRNKKDMVLTDWPIACVCVRRVK